MADFIDLDKLLARRNGIIRELASSSVPKGEPKLYTYNAVRGVLPWESQDGHNTMGSGCGERLPALISCCGELVERYCSSFVSRDLIYGSFQDLCRSYRTENPEKFNFFSDQQYQQAKFPFTKLDKTTCLNWVEVEDYTQQHKCYIPAFSVYLPYNLEKQHYSVMTSTGLSCCSSVDSARYKGICEIIERDAFTTFWIHQLSPPQIILPDTEKYQKLRQQFCMEQIRFILLDLTSDFGIPVVAAFSFGDASFGYCAALGLGCHHDPYVAIKKALTENVQARLAVYHHRRMGIRKSFHEDFLDVNDFTDHLYLYSSDRKLREKISFIDASSTKIHVSQMSRITPQEVLQKIREQKYCIYYKDLTTEDVRETGFYVVRVVIPELTLLHGIHALPFLGSLRLQKPQSVFSWISGDIPVSENFQKFPPHMLG